MSVDVGLDELGDDVLAGLLGPDRGQLHRVHDQFHRRVAFVVVRELRIVVGDHLVGPVEELLAVLQRDADQSGDGLQRQFARHLLDEVARAFGGGALGDVLGALVEVVTQPLDGPRREAARDDLAQMRVVRCVHVQQDELAGLDLLSGGAVGIAGQRGLLETGEDVAALGDLLDVLVLGHHPVAAVVEPADAVGLLVPPDRRAAAQLGEFLHRQPLAVEVGIGEIESGREGGSRHALAPKPSSGRIALLHHSGLGETSWAKCAPEFVSGLSRPRCNDFSAIADASSEKRRNRETRRGHR